VIIHKIANNSAAIEARAKIRADMESLEFLATF
jgi:hypothetical protein